MRSLALGDVEPEHGRGLRARRRGDRGAARAGDAAALGRRCRIPTTTPSSRRPRGRRALARARRLRRARRRPRRSSAMPRTAGGRSPTPSCGPARRAPEELARRKAAGTFTAGQALIAALLEACLDAGVELRTGTSGSVLPARTPSSSRAGASSATSGSSRRSSAGRWSRRPASRRTRETGCGSRWPPARRSGTMSEAWWAPAVRLPGETIDGRPMYRLVLGRARRVPAASSSTGRAAASSTSRRTTTTSGARSRTSTRRRSRTGTCRRGSSSTPTTGARTARSSRSRPTTRTPDWLVAGRHGRRPGCADRRAAGGACETVDRFSRAPAPGEDPEFGRGSYAYDRFLGAPRPARRGAVLRARAAPGVPGTKGGPRTDAHGRVLSAADGGRSRPLRGGKRRGEPVRARLPRGGRDDRSGARLRRAGRRGGGNRLIRRASATRQEAAGRRAGRRSRPAARSPPSAARARSPATCRRSSTRAARRPWPRART